MLASKPSVGGGQRIDDMAEISIAILPIRICEEANTPMDAAISTMFCCYEIVPR
jgi:hypothetical protein